MTEYDFSNFSDFSADFGGGALSQSPTSAVQIVVVDADTAVSDYLAGLLDSPAQLSSAAEVEAHAKGNPVAVVLGPSCEDDAEMAIVEQWSNGSADIEAVMVTAELSTDLLHRALRAGVRDVLSAPIEPETLAEAVNRLTAKFTVAESADLAPAAAAPDDSMFDPSQMGSLISVFSTKGGSGKSITASNLAVLLAQSSDRPVVLVDGHLQFGDQEVMLKLQAEHTVVDAIEKIDEADAGFIEQLMATHSESGLLVLAAPREPTFADQITSQQFKRLLKICQLIGGHVVVDLPAFFNEVVISTLEMSNDIVLVAGLDIPNIKNVKIGLRTLSMLGISEDSIHLVLNRADSKVKLDIGEVERTLGAKKAIHVPSDVVVPISVNKGSPAVLSASKSGVARSFSELAGRFVGEVSASPSSAHGRRKFFG